jgi:Peptidyl-prolyl cis-trans isomerase (rotamase) - cyclophilin family
MRQVDLETSAGTIRVELDDEKAPETVKNFLTNVENGHYDGTVFHRVIKGFMIQGGGFEPGMSQKPTGSSINNEASNGLKNDRTRSRWRARRRRTRRRRSSSSTPPTTSS